MEMLVPALTNPPMQPAWSDCARACPTVDRTVVFPCDERYLASGMISPEVVAVRGRCDDEGVTLIEDAAHAHGSSLDDRPAGSWSRAAAFSFYPTKVVAGAEGGMILTAEEHLSLIHI